MRKRSTFICTISELLGLSKAAQGLLFAKFCVTTYNFLALRERAFCRGVIAPMV
jgi:hypothetical protein